MSYSTPNQFKITSSSQIDFNSVVVYLSDAEATVIENKAKKANLSVDEYIRNAALGFPMS